MTVCLQKKEAAAPAAALEGNGARVVFQRLSAVQPHVGAVELLHVGQDDLVACVEALDHLDRADGGAAELHRDAGRPLAVLDDLVDLDLAVLLPNVGRSTNRMLLSRSIWTVPSTVRPGRAP